MMINIYMFTINRRKRLETNKQTYYANLINNHLSPQNGVIPELQENPLWLVSENNSIVNYNKNGRVGINKHDLSINYTLDVQGTINASQDIKINNISVALPSGSIISYVGLVIPDGYLLCDGSEVSRTTYSELFNAIGTYYGHGDYFNTFNVPNFKGAFLRGAGQGLYGYVGPDLYQYQIHTIHEHNHAIHSTVTDPGHNHTATSSVTDPGHNHTATSSVTDPGHSHGIVTRQDDYNNVGGSVSDLQDYPPSFGLDNGVNVTTNNITTSTTGITVGTTVNNGNTGVSVGTTVNNGNTGISVSSSTISTFGGSNVSSETRPYNVGVHYLIKF